MSMQDAFETDVVVSRYPLSQEVGCGQNMFEPTPLTIPVKEYLFSFGPANHVVVAVSPVQKRLKFRWP